jgi:hypothetical protein
LYNAITEAIKGRVEITGMVTPALHGIFDLQCGFVGRIADSIDAVAV